MRLLSLCGVGMLLGRSRHPASRDTSTSLYVEMLMYYRVHSAGQEARMSRAQGCAGATASSQHSA